jgi:hypothetical protein
VVDPKTPTPAKGTPVVNQLLGINNKDVAAGFYNDAHGTAHAYTYDLKHHSFHAVNPPHAKAATATGINDRGNITGFLTLKNGNTASFLERNGHFTEFEFPGSTNTTAFGLNNADVIVGSYVDKSNQIHGFIHSGGLYQSIDDPNGAAGTTLLNGINNRDSIVGFSTDAKGNTNGFEANPAWNYTFQTLNDANDPTFNQLLGINDSAVIAGYLGSGTPPTTHPNKGYVLSPPYGQNNYKKSTFQDRSRRRLRESTTSEILSAPGSTRTGLTSASRTSRAVTPPSSILTHQSPRRKPRPSTSSWASTIIASLPASMSTGRETRTATPTT